MMTVLPSVFLMGLENVQSDLPRLDNHAALITVTPAEQDNSQPLLTIQTEHVVTLQPHLSSADNLEVNDEVRRRRR